MTIEKMVDRFLCWQLPSDFAPDGGISFTPIKHPSNPWPVGTNLLTATQARQMLEFVLAKSDGSGDGDVKGGWRLRETARAEAAEARVAELEKDAERLNEIERTQSYPFFNGSGWIFLVTENWRSSKVIARGEGPTARAAIDAALSAARKEG